MRSLLVLASLLLLSSSAAARTWLFPHAPMSSGTIASPQNFDCTAEFLYGAGLDYGLGLSTDSATIDFHMFNPDGTPVRASGSANDVCNPCTWVLNSTSPKALVRLDDLIIADGGFPSSVLTPFVIVNETGDADNVARQAYTTNSHTGPLDLTFFPMPGRELGPTSGIYVFPIVSETSGTIASPNEFDTSIQMAYVAGLAGIPAGAGVSVSLYLFDDATGQALTAMGGAPVCSPCALTMGSAPEKQIFQIQNLVEAAGGFATSVITACGVLVTSGDIDNFAAAGYVINSHTGPLDISALAYAPNEVPGPPPRTAVTPGQLSELVRGLRGVPNPFNPRTRVEFSLAAPAEDVRVDIFDARGRHVRALHRGSLAEGSHSLAWDGRDGTGTELASGVYMAHVRADGTRSTQKLVLVR